MKKILLFLCLLLLAASCASLTVGGRQSQLAVEPLVYYDGNDKPAAMGMFRYSDEQ